MGRQLTVAQLIDELEDLVEYPEDTKVYIASYQRYTPPEDMAVDVLVISDVGGEGEERVYLEADQTGEYIPGVVRDEFGW